MLPRQPSARTLTDRRGVTFDFDSGSTSLDFAYTGGEGKYSVFEILHTPADLSSWLAAAGLNLPALEIDAELLAGAKRLRAAIWTELTAVATGTKPAPTAIATLNDWARRAPLIPQLTDSGLQWSAPSAEQVLVAMARETIELVTGQPDRIRQCAADDCPLMFYDDSRTGRRRWCSMQRCGNRNKVRTHRSRAAER